MTKARTLANFDPLASTGTACSFFRRVSSDSVHQNISNGKTAINYGTEIFDTGSDTNSAGVFTAPVTGKYLFTVKTTFGNLRTTHTLIDYWLESYTGASLTQRVRDMTNTERDFSANASDYHTLGFTTLMALTAGDTVVSNLYLTGESGSLDIIGGSTDNLYTYFQGHLVEE